VMAFACGVKIMSKTSPAMPNSQLTSLPWVR
jgi:hypothetical protein